jgi:signal transduction histidine kinase
MLRGLARRHEIQVVLTHDGADQPLDPAIEVATYRIVQEGLTNVAKHARAAHCRVTLGRHGDSLVVDVVDDGEGFDVHSLGATPPRLGLVGIRERAAHLGGSLEVTSSPGRGTHLHVELPLAPAAAQETTHA